MAAEARATAVCAKRRAANECRHRHILDRVGICAPAASQSRVGAEFQAEPVVVDPEIAVAAARHRVRHHRLHLLRHHADIGLVAAEIAEAVVAEAVVEMAEQDDVVLQRDVGTPATAAATAATAATESAAAAAAAAKAAPPPPRKPPPPAKLARAAAAPPKLAWPRADEHWPPCPTTRS